MALSWHTSPQVKLFCMLFYIRKEFPAFRSNMAKLRAVAATAALLVSVLSLAATVEGLYMVIVPGSMKCFLEDVPADTSMSMEWSVEGGQDRCHLESVLVTADCFYFQSQF